MRACQRYLSVVHLYTFFSLQLFLSFKKEFDRLYERDAELEFISKKRDLCKSCSASIGGGTGSPVAANKNEDLKNGQVRWRFARHAVAAQEWQAGSPDRGRILRMRDDGPMRRASSVAEGEATFNCCSFG